MILVQSGSDPLPCPADGRPLRQAGPAAAQAAQSAAACAAEHVPAAAAAGRLGGTARWSAARSAPAAPAGPAGRHRPTAAAAHPRLEPAPAGRGRLPAFVFAQPGGSPSHEAPGHRPARRPGHDQGDAVTHGKFRGTRGLRSLHRAVTRQNESVSVGSDWFKDSLCVFMT